MSCAPKIEVRGLAHITGGGLLGNVPRSLPSGMGARLDRDSWPVPPIFRALKAAGGVQADEMWRTFNMGIGMVVVVPAGAAAGAGKMAAGLPVLRIGEIVDAGEGHRVLLR